MTLITTQIAADEASKTPAKTHRVDFKNAVNKGDPPATQFCFPLQTPARGVSNLISKVV